MVVVVMVRIQFYFRSSTPDENKKTAAISAAGGEKYVVIEKEIKGTYEVNANRGPARLNLKRCVAK